MLFFILEKYLQIINCNSFFLLPHAASNTILYGSGKNFNRTQKLHSKFIKYYVLISLFIHSFPPGLQLYTLTSMALVLQAMYYDYIYPRMKRSKQQQKVLIFDNLPLRANALGSITLMKVRIMILV